MNHPTTHTCDGQYPGRHHRACNACARLRQARIADVAEKLLGHHPSIAWITLTPTANHAATIAALRAAYLRQAGTQAGLWTIEQGEQAGLLHCNILTEHHAIPKTRGALIHVQPVKSGLRVVAAYISKPAQFPRLPDFNGRIYGSYGMIKDWLTAPEVAPVPRAAYVERHIIAPSVPGFAAALAALDAESRVPPADRKPLNQSEAAHRLGSEIRHLQRMDANQRHQYMQRVEQVRGLNAARQLLERLRGTPLPPPDAGLPPAHFREVAMRRLPLVRALLEQAGKSPPVDSA